MGLAHLRLNEYDDAIAAFKKQIEINPKDETVYDFLGVTLVQQQKLDEAAVAFRKQIELKPLDKFAHASLGLLLVQQKKFAEAIPDLEKAAVLAPDNSQLQLTLADAYVNAGRTKDAVAAFDKAANISPTPEIWNNIAQLLSQKDLDLEKAAQYAGSAVDAASASLKTADLDHLTDETLAQVQNLGTFWDTLGWIRVRLWRFRWRRAVSPFCVETYAEWRHRRSSRPALRKTQPKSLGDTNILAGAGSPAFAERNAGASRGASR